MVAASGIDVLAALYSAGGQDLLEQGAVLAGLARGDAVEVQAWAWKLNMMSEELILHVFHPLIDQHLLRSCS